jgi:FAD/FMN-containing dehydrogenase
LWADLDRATAPFGLATTGGVISHTGIGGLTLGGGLGHLMRKHGLTVDNLLSVDLVTSDGEPMNVDAESEPELFWGIRGGGGNFGIVTAFEYRLHPVGPLVLGGPIAWPFEEAGPVLRSVRDFAREAPDELGITIGMMHAPPAPFMPPEQYGKKVVAVIPVWFGDLAEGEHAIAPLRSIAPAIADAVRPVPYQFVQSMLDAGAPHGRHYYWRSHRIPSLTDEAIGVFVERIGSMTSPFSQINGWATGGAVSRVDPDATAVGEREFGFHIGINAGWPPSDADPERHIEWVRRAWEDMRPFSTGVYVNFLSDEGTAGIDAAYGKRLERLTALKDRYDPTNFFRLNANIPPSR